MTENTRSTYIFQISTTISFELNGVNTQNKFLLKDDLDQFMTIFLSKLRSKVLVILIMFAYHTHSKSYRYWQIHIKNFYITNTSR